MQGLICGNENDEIYLLEMALRNAGFEILTGQTVEKVVQNWSDQPAEFLVVVQSHTNTEDLLQIHSLRSVMIVPIILITDALSEDSCIDFLVAGVDMIIHRPYSLRLLPHQIRPLLLRSNTIPLSGLPDLRYKSIHLDNRSRNAILGDKHRIHLTQLEYRLLYTLMVHQGQVLSTEQIVSMVWGYPNGENRELVRGLIQRLRAKIEPDSQNPRFILTEPGIGYLFNDHTEE